MTTSRKYVSILVLLSFNLLFADTTTRLVNPKFTIRSQELNAVRRATASLGRINRHDLEKTYASTAWTIEYTRSFRSDDIVECLFGNAACENSIQIQGSRVEDRNSCALLADYFYLPTDFSSTVCLEPRIQNVISDFHLFVDFQDDCWCPGLYFWVHAPIVYTNWDINFCETVCQTGEKDHDAGYFTADTLEREKLLSNFGSYVAGCTPGTIKQTITINSDEQQVNVVLHPLKFAKMCPEKDTKTTIPEIRWACGYNFLRNDDYHVGVNLQVAIPTGNDPQPTLLFAAQNGNDDHWEFGGSIHGHFALWQSDDEERSFNFYADVNLTHMFKNHQKRTFDLACKPLSRYMLATKMAPQVTTPNSGLQTDSNIIDGVKAAAQFVNEIAPVANLTTVDVNVEINLQADVVAMLNYSHNNWSFDLGYNFWARTCEEIHLRCECEPFAENSWALKGDAHVFGFLSNEPTAIELSASQSEATIHGGTNLGTEGVTDTEAAAGRLNPNIDNPYLAAFGSTNLFAEPNTNAMDRRINTSIDPIFISVNDLQLVGTRGMSHKVFLHINYTWKDRNSSWIPFIGFGAEAEFAHTEDDCEKSCHDTCLRCAVSQWGVWLKGGVSIY